MRHFYVYSDVRRYVRAIIGGTILWTADANTALPMTRAEATTLADRLQRSAADNHPACQPAGEYGVDTLEVTP